MEASKADGLTGLAYDLSLRTLSQQEATLDELRGRTGTLLTATALVTSFLGARALQEPAYKWLTIPGLAAAVLAIVLSVYVLTPKANLNFAIHGDAIYEYFSRAGADVEEAHRTLAYWNREAWDANQRVLYRLVAYFRIAQGGLVLAIIPWSLKLPLH